MAIFSLKNIKSSNSPFKTKYLNELQVNGEEINDNDDFTMEDEDNQNNEESTDTGSETAETGENTPEDAAQDAAENPNEEDSDTAEYLGADTDTEDIDDFTLDDEDNSSTANDNESSSDNGDNEEDNFTLDDEPPAEGEESGGKQEADQPAESAPTEEDNTDTSEGGGDAGTDDFTMDDESTEGGEGGGEVAGGEAPGEGSGDDAGSGSTAEAPPADPTDNISDEDVKAAEEQIYDSLTDDQKRIRVLQLKIDYKDLYETIITTKEGINSIPKTMDNLDTIKKLTLFTEKTKNILIDYIQNNFDKNPYLENYAMYIKFMAVFRTISKVIEELNTARK